MYAALSYPLSHCQIFLDTCAPAWRVLAARPGLRINSPCDRRVAEAGRPSLHRDKKIFEAGASRWDWSFDWPLHPGGIPLEIFPRGGVVESRQSTGAIPRVVFTPY